MSETKWTPGPWEISSTFTGPHVISPAGKKDDAIAFVFGETFRQVQEDARLISAAPDMAEALARAVNTLAMARERLEQAGFMSAAADCSEDESTARSALAKARGET